MALTLLEASKQSSGDVIRSAVIENFARESDLLRVIPWMNIPGGSYHYTQEGKLPGVAFRGINEGYEQSTGIMNPQVEVLRIAGGELDVDKALIKMHGPQIRTTQENMKIKALSLNITRKLIDGDSASNPKEFDGIKNRIVGGQLLSAGSTAGGAALSLTALDECIDAVEGPTHIIMSKAMRRLLTAAARNTGTSGFITYDLDEFGRKIAFYNDLPILIVDYDDEGKRIIDFNEPAASGPDTATSIYVVSFGDGKLTGLQNGTMDVEDLGDLKTLPLLRTRVEWLVGMAAMHGRCAARLCNIGDLPIVA